MAQCKGIKADGNRCSYQAKEGSDYCGMHQEDYEGGRPTKFDCIDIGQVEILASKGFTDVEMSEFFGVSKQTWNNYKKQYPEFFDSLKRGKNYADAKVEASLYQRAIGYSHPEVKIMQHDGMPIKVDLIKHYPPDTAAAFIWLKNRQPEKWKDSPDTPPDKPNYEQYLKALGTVAEDVWQESKQD